jgi:hypothetical protein
MLSLDRGPMLGFTCWRAERGEAKLAGCNRGLEGCGISTLRCRMRVFSLRQASAPKLLGNVDSDRIGYQFALQGL